MPDGSDTELRGKDLEEFLAQRICMNCNQYFPAYLNEPTEYGVCLLDKDFEPYIEEIMEDDFSSCQELIDGKRFDGNREVCEEFIPVEYIEIDLDLDPERVDALSRDELKDYFWEQLVAKQNISVEAMINELKSSDSEKKEQMVKTLGDLSSSGNKEAFQVLLSYLKSLPVVKTIEDTHHKVEILKTMKDDPDLLAFLSEELYRTPSNNTTRQWITAIFDYMKESSLSQAKEALEKIAADKEHFSHRLRKKAKDIIDFKIRWGV